MAKGKPGKDCLEARGSGALMQWPADKIERKDVSTLIPYARNARTHTDQQVSQIASSIKEWGWTNPVLVDPEGGIIAGHGRVMAAQKLGIKDIPVMVAEGWSEAKKKAYILADNQLALNAGWDVDMLKIELSELDSKGFDLSLIGFSTEWMAQMFLDPDFGPGDAADQGRLDSIAPQVVCCPNCGEEFNGKEHVKG